jgi:trehalose 6-phosphate phosphatase
MSSHSGSDHSGSDVGLDPEWLATECALLPRPWLVGVDVDGTLAPIVSRPELSQLAPDALDSLDHLTRAVGVMVAVVSGRPLTDLRHRFDIPSSVILLGSHGAEVGSEVDERTVEEQLLIDSTIEVLESIVARLPGSWIEHKPLAVALHVRQADPVAGEAALDEVVAQFATTDALTLHRGHKVVEVAIRPVSKTTAFQLLRSRLEPATTFFIGDDQSDEHVFASLGRNDVAVKVGRGSTAASHRLTSPTEVVAFLRGLARELDAEQPATDQPETDQSGTDQVRTGER